MKWPRKTFDANGTSALKSAAFLVCGLLAFVGCSSSNGPEKSDTSCDISSEKDTLKERFYSEGEFTLEEYQAICKSMPEWSNVNSQVTCEANEQNGSYHKVEVVATYEVADLEDESKAENVSLDEVRPVLDSSCKGLMKSYGDR